MMENNNVSFEAALKELEAIVKELENKEIPLEKSVDLYAKGLEYSQLCYKLLNQSEKLILEKMTENGLEKLEEDRWFYVWY